MAAWRCLLRQISDAPLPFRSPSTGWPQRPAAWLMANRSGSSDQPGSGPDLQPGCAKPNRRRRPASAKPGKERHLYVALEDDDENGFAIHKLDGSDLDGAARSGSTEPLPPPVVRVDSLRRGIEGKPRQFAALGSSIVVTGMRRVENSTGLGGVTVIYDTDTAALTESDHYLPGGLFHGPDLAVAAGNRLYLLESYSMPFERCSHSVYYHGGLHCLKTADPNDRPDCRDSGGWQWRALPDSSGFTWSSNLFPPQLPFDAASISSYAVHPRGHTIFVSTPSEWKAPLGTFSYSTATGRWKRRGEWLLPFSGPTLYDHDLDAWVGLYLDPDDKIADHLEDTPGVGYLCASRVMCARATQPPEWKKVSIEELASEDEHVKVQLLYMRERGEYCLVEHLLDDRYKLVLRLTVFLLNYSEDGELVVTARRPARSYDVPNESLDAQAFWM